MSFFKGLGKVLGKVGSTVLKITDVAAQATTGVSLNLYGMTKQGKEEADRAAQAAYAANGLNAGMLGASPYQYASPTPITGAQPFDLGKLFKLPSLPIGTDDSTNKSLWLIIGGAVLIVVLLITGRR